MTIRSKTAQKTVFTNKKVDLSAVNFIMKIFYSPAFGLLKKTDLEWVFFSGSELLIECEIH